MFSSLIDILVLWGALAFTAQASPAATTTSCQPFTTYTAKFDKLAAGSSPPAGFQSALWSGWTVANVSEYGMNPKSSPHAIQSSDAETSTITITGGVVMLLKSFYFGCFSDFPDSSVLITSACSIMVTSLAYTHIIGIESKGPFNYAVNYTALQEQHPESLKKVDLEVESSEFYFQIVAGPSSSRLVLDNVVMVQGNYCPS